MPRNRNGSGSQFGDRWFTGGSDVRLESMPSINSAIVRPPRFAVATPLPVYARELAMFACRSKENVGIKSFEMGVLMLHPGQSWGYPDHRHEDEEAYFILDGTGVQIIDEREFDIDKNMAIYLPPNSLHITKNTGNETLRVLYIRKPEKYR